MNTTTKAAHTAGPWVLDQNCGRPEHEAEIKQQPGGWFLVIGAGYPFEKMAYPDDARIEFEANARLIAAAPEVLAALTALTDARALSGVRELVSGWNGEHLPEPHMSRHPSSLGAHIKTNCGAIYALDEALVAARAAIAKAGAA